MQVKTIFLAATLSVVPGLMHAQFNFNTEGTEPTPGGDVAHASFLTQNLHGSGMAKLGLAGGSAMILPGEPRVVTHPNGKNLWRGWRGALGGSHTPDKQH